jgi:hypothetical protein
MSTSYTTFHDGKSWGTRMHFTWMCQKKKAGDSRNDFPPETSFVKQLFIVSSKKIHFLLIFSLRIFLYIYPSLSTRAGFEIKNDFGFQVEIIFFRWFRFRFRFQEIPNWRISISISISRNSKLKDFDFDFKKFSKKGFQDLKSFWLFLHFFKFSVTLRARLVNEGAWEMRRGRHVNGRREAIQHQFPTTLISCEI